MATVQQQKNTMSQYLAPGAFNIAPSHIQVGDRFARTIFLATYPRYLQTNWFSPIINLDRVFYFTQKYGHDVETAKRPADSP